MPRTKPKKEEGRGHKKWWWNKEKRTRMGKEIRKRYTPGKVKGGWGKPKETKVKNEQKYNSQDIIHISQICLLITVRNVRTYESDFNLLLFCLLFCLFRIQVLFLEQVECVLDSLGHSPLGVLGQAEEVRGRQQKAENGQDQEVELRDRWNGLVQLCQERCGEGKETGMYRVCQKDVPLNCSTAEHGPVTNGEAPDTT